MIFCNAIYFYLMLTSWKHNFKTMISLKDRELSFLLSIGSIGNALGKALTGLLLLKLNFKVLYISSNCLIVIYALTFNVVMASAGNIVTASAYLGSAFFGLGMTMTMFPTACMKVFGGSIGSKVYPILYFCFALSNIAAYLFYKHVENTKVLFTMMGLFASIGIIACIIFELNPTWAKSTEAKSSIGMELTE